MVTRSPGGRGRTLGYRAELDVVLDTLRVPLGDGSVALVEVRQYDGGVPRVAWAREVPAKTKAQAGSVITDRGRFRCQPEDVAVLGAALIQLSERLKK